MGVLLSDLGNHRVNEVTFKEETYRLMEKVPKFTAEQSLASPGNLQGGIANTPSVAPGVEFDIWCMIECLGTTFFGCAYGLVSPTCWVA